MRSLGRCVASSVMACPRTRFDESTFCRYLFTAHCPDPDLIIRTGGEQRISNFLLWQSAYSEFYHTCTLWPDLEPAELERALKSYRTRQRRYGKVAESET